MLGINLGWREGTTNTFVFHSDRKGWVTWWRTALLFGMGWAVRPGGQQWVPVVREVSSGFLLGRSAVGSC